MCDVKHCRKETELVFYGKDVCNHHWMQHCAGKVNLMQIFNIEEEAVVINEIQ
jgi:hypothetical protein